MTHTQKELLPTYSVFNFDYSYSFCHIDSGQIGFFSKFCKLNISISWEHCLPPTISPSSFLLLSYCAKITPLRSGRRPKSKIRKSRLEIGTFLFEQLFVYNQPPPPCCMYDSHYNNFLVQMLMTTNNPSMILQKQQQGNDLHPKWCLRQSVEKQKMQKIHVVLTRSAHF